MHGQWQTRNTEHAAHRSQNHFHYSSHFYTMAFTVRNPTRVMPSIPEIILFAVFYSTFFFSPSLTLSLSLSLSFVSLYASRIKKTRTGTTSDGTRTQRERERERESIRDDFYLQVRKALLIFLISVLSKHFSFTAVSTFVLWDRPGYALLFFFFRRTKVYPAKTALYFGLKRAEEQMESVFVDNGSLEIVIKGATRSAISLQDFDAFLFYFRFNSISLKTDVIRNGKIQIHWILWEFYIPYIQTFPINHSEWLASSCNTRATGINYYSGIFNECNERIIVWLTVIIFIDKNEYRNISPCFYLILSVVRYFILKKCAKRMKS